MRDVQMTPRCIASQSVMYSKSSGSVKRFRVNTGFARSPTCAASIPRMSNEPKYRHEQAMYWELAAVRLRSSSQYDELSSAGYPRRTS
eukprot:3824800-Prymnesium_polylepis.1